MNSSLSYATHFFLIYQTRNTVRVSLVNIVLLEIPCHQSVSGVLFFGLIRISFRRKVIEKKNRETMLLSKDEAKISFNKKNNCFR